MTTPSRKPTAPPPYSPPAAAAPNVKDASSSPGPSHDYTAHQQSFLRNSTIEALQSGESSSTVHDSLFEYFAARPPPGWSPDEPLRHRLAIPPTADPDAFPFPQPGEMWLARDVNQLDWSTFLNYLLPLQHGETKSAEPWPSSGSCSPVSRKPLPMPPTDVRKGEHMRTGSSGSGGLTMTNESEPERQQRIQDATQRWNQGFFQPRGLLVEVSVIPYVSALMTETGPAARETITPSVTLRDAVSPSSARQGEMATASYISAEPDEVAGPSSPRLGSPSGRAVNASSRELAPDVAGTRTLPSYHSRPQSPSSLRPQSTLPARPTELPSSEREQRPQTAGVAESLATKQTLPDDLEEGDLQELRGAFAKFLLAPRSRDETAAALHEINRELQTRRQHTAKQLKVEIKTQRKEIKVMSIQHKADRRAEKKRIKDAHRAHKAELKALKQSQKELEKQQKEARKEAKTFKKNARKAEKQKGDGAPPYKGWLEALELNRQESGVAQRAEPGPSTTTEPR
ncbi:MAG: hypothetical protein M1823_005378 [Watsoniomyces obsoletus]|nr:MAG: hypothetical protein M1823_005378 [Watsoniomyces obsoletus]